MRMENDTVFMVLKGFGLVGGAMVGSALGSTSQWVNAGSSPTWLDWFIMALGVLSAGMAALVAFVSGSAVNWRSKRENGNGNTTPPTP